MVYNDHTPTIRSHIANLNPMLKKLCFCLLLSLTTYGQIAVATEEPPYTAILTEGSFEIREYPSLIAAEVAVTGERSEAISAGFRLLAGYIFGGNTRKQSIAMTAPVTQTQQGNEKIAMTAPVTQSGNELGWTVRFIMPQGYTLDTLPIPNDSRVKLIALESARVAVVKFSGLAKEPEIIERTQQLKQFMQDQKLVAVGSETLARYDPPWTLWFLRRNELMIKCL
jgi:hypothetical protein